LYHVQGVDIGKVEWTLYGGNCYVNLPPALILVAISNHEDPEEPAFYYNDRIYSTRIVAVLTGLEEGERFYV
jgi:hypothetical protein